MKIKKYILNISLITTVLLFNIGCAEKNLKEEENIKKVQYNKFVINTDDDDDLKEIKNIKIDVNTNNMLVGETIELIFEKTKTLAVFNETSISNKMKTLNLNNMYLYDIIHNIENTADVDIIFKNNKMFILNTMNFIDKFDDSKSIKNQVDLIKIKEDLNKLLENNCNININEYGFNIQRSPNVIRKNKYAVEKIINEINSLNFTNQEKQENIKYRKTKTNIVN